MGFVTTLQKLSPGIGSLAGGRSDTSAYTITSPGSNSFGMSENSNLISSGIRRMSLGTDKSLTGVVLFLLVRKQIITYIQIHLLLEMVNYCFHKYTNIKFYWSIFIKSLHIQLSKWVTVHMYQNGKNSKV